jgi:DNA repair exonuclease SbcCD nuclease subunit
MTTPLIPTTLTNALSKLDAIEGLSPARRAALQAHVRTILDQTTQRVTDRAKAERAELLEKRRAATATRRELQADVERTNADAAAGKHSAAEFTNIRKTQIAQLARLQRQADEIARQAASVEERLADPLDYYQALLDKYPALPRPSFQF